MDTTNTKSLTDAGYVLMSHLAKRGLFPVEGAKVVIYRGREYALQNATILRLRADEWPEHGRFPKAGEQPDADGRFVQEQTESVASKTEWDKRGWRLAPGAQSVATKSYYKYGQGSITYELYRESDTLAKRTKPQMSDGQNLGIDSLLDAIFSVNRAAKRRRDAASSQYAAGNHGFAGHQRTEKESLYLQKDRGIRAAINLGLLRFDGVHGKLAIWAGGGYRFHSTLAPTGTLVDESQDHHVSEAKPKDVKELRLLDACATIEAMTAPDAVDLGLINLKVQRFERTPRRLPDHREDVWDDDLEFEGE